MRLSLCAWRSSPGHVLLVCCALPSESGKFFILSHCTILCRFFSASASVLPQLLRLHTSLLRIRLLSHLRLSLVVRDMNNMISSYKLKYFEFQ